METVEKKPGRPSGVPVYVTASQIATSKGTLFHGDRAHLPKDEAEKLKKVGAVT